MNKYTDKMRFQIERLADGIKGKEYNCDCQVGGVDAMSIDTDFLNDVVRQMNLAIAEIDDEMDLLERGFSC